MFTIYQIPLYMTEPPCKRLHQTLLLQWGEAWYWTNHYPKLKPEETDHGVFAYDGKTLYVLGDIHQGGNTEHFFPFTEMMEFEEDLETIAMLEARAIAAIEKCETEWIESLKL
jgi:hypothetical protein